MHFVKTRQKLPLLEDKVVILYNKSGSQFFTHTPLTPSNKLGGLWGIGGFGWGVKIGEIWRSEKNLRMKMPFFREKVAKLEISWIIFTQIILT